jgi:hypothetical protein
MTSTAGQTEHAGFGAQERGATPSPLVVEGLLWLLILNLGVALGAGLYEARIVVPSWLPFSSETGPVWDAAAAREANTGLRFWVYVTTGPLTLLTLASLIAVWWTKGAVRKWWLIALGAALVDRVMTLAYFIPTMVRLTNETMTTPEATQTAMQWMGLNNVRHLATAIALLAALKCFSVFYTERGRATAERA